MALPDHHYQAPAMRPSQAALPTPAELPTLGMHPLQAQLRERVTVAGEELIAAFTYGLDGAVQSLLAESRHSGETRAALDLGHSLSLSRPALLRGFTAALRRRFDPLQQAAAQATADLERLCRIPAEEREENLVLARLAELADEKAGEAGRQLSSRLQIAARKFGLPALSEALSASTLPHCFNQAFRAAGLDAGERLLAYRLVESHALVNWPDLVHTAERVLDEQGLHAARSVSGNDSEAIVAPPLSSATVQTLREAKASLVSGADGALAQALLQAIEPPLCADRAGLITALAGSWVDSLLAEPELPLAFSPDLESLRFAVIKAALCDPSFFSQPLHPVRKAVDELVQSATFIGLQGYSLASVRLALKEVYGRISIHGQFALDALSMLPALDADLPQQFQQQLGKDQAQRRESLLNRVRTLATREVEARTLDVTLPAAARAALTRGFLPLLSTLMLRHGATAPATRQARQLLERFVDSFALCVGSSERHAVLRALCDLLVDAGLPDLHISEVCTELETAYHELEEEAQIVLPNGDSASAQREINDILAGMGVASLSDTYPTLPLPAAAPPAMPVTPSNTPSANRFAPASESAPLKQLLKPGQWFRVRDYKRGDDRWLALASVNLDQDRISFSGFDGATVLAMRAAQFIEDLTAGLAEPLNPDPQVQQALSRLRTPANDSSGLLNSFG